MRAEVLILGGTGMLGHKMFQLLRQRFPETYCTIRGSIDDEGLRNVDLYHGGGIIERCEAADFNAVEQVLQEYKPKFVVNCIGVVKQRPDSRRAVPSILLNALFPHQVSEVCQRWGGRLVHFSTDCVFSGRRGGYREEDVADADDLYGRTKFLGEVADGGALTLRTSIIGRELTGSRSLLEWLLSQNHKQIRGYTGAMYSGVTTLRLAGVVGDIIERRPALCGLYQVTAPTISKFELLSLLREAYKLDIDIVPDGEVFCDRSMRGEKFEAATGFLSPPWPKLAAQLAKDETPYEEWRAVKHELL